MVYSPSPLPAQPCRAPGFSSQALCACAVPLCQGSGHGTQGTLRAGPSACSAPTFGNSRGGVRPAPGPALLADKFLSLRAGTTRVWEYWCAGVVWSSVDTGLCLCVQLWTSVTICHHLNSGQAPPSATAPDLDPSTGACHIPGEGEGRQHRRNTGYCQWSSGWPWQGQELGLAVPGGSLRAQDTLSAPAAGSAQISLTFTAQKSLLSLSPAVNAPALCHSPGLAQPVARVPLQGLCSPAQHGCNHQLETASASRSTTEHQ